MEFPSFIEALQKLYQAPLTKLSSSYSSIASFIKTLNPDRDPSYQLILSHSNLSKQKQSL
jgi:hypothetical protein